MCVPEAKVDVESMKSEEPGRPNNALVTAAVIFFGLKVELVIARFDASLYGVCAPEPEAEFDREDLLDS